ncbi:MAG TPA: hypothetical protein VFS83_14300 [Ktedonobacterales bacterium]|nr:hypothetical protein [Ktedonobacterales bacterium]
MLTSPAQHTRKSSLVVPIILGVTLVPLSQIGMAFLGANGASLLPWLVGTPICYFLIGGVGAFTTVSGLVPSQARGRGAWVGLIVGISGACTAGLIVAAFVIWNFAIPPQSALLLHPHAGVMPRALYFGMTMPGSPRVWLALALIFFVPIFLGVNLLGIGLAPLGGLLGGYLRARVSPPSATLPEQPDEQAMARSGRRTLVITIIAVLLAIIVMAVGIFYAVGAFPATTG